MEHIATITLNNTPAHPIRDPGTSAERVDWTSTVMLTGTFMVIDANADNLGSTVWVRREDETLEWAIDGRELID